MTMQKTAAILVLGASVLVWSGTASAHVTVWPKESKSDSYERYTIRVPVEKETNTTKVRIEFPQGVKVGTVLPVPGWSYEFEKSGDGQFTAITWTATAGGIKPHEFMEFGISAKNPKEAGTLIWKSYQTYADGSVVEWTGAPDAKTPAPTVTLKEAEKDTDSHGSHNDNSQDTKKETVPQPKHEAGKENGASATNSNLGPWFLSGAALLLSLIGLFRKKA
ncbi:YcnI family protein [Effusibacillus lacus]|uniref:YncI copper-binding domain-containing protein n=1 Tax=Effusibacillus lacus TaxID=1348429 RepID=A0A292YU27_9BACL|nr:YcnI family protein [Effusibacillus lacus]TCS73551.1 uncharacterized protein YcnI [Effusibacillus lacus]GAX91954.1 hypothetical protein EFBL_3645 [Effusibacillus lacus]